MNELELRSYINECVAEVIIESYILDEGIVSKVAAHGINKAIDIFIDANSDNIKQFATDQAEKCKKAGMNKKKAKEVVHQKASEFVAKMFGLENGLTTKRVLQIIFASIVLITLVAMVVDKCYT